MNRDIRDRVIASIPLIELAAVLAKQAGRVWEATTIEQCAALLRECADTLADKEPR